MNRKARQQEEFISAAGHEYRCRFRGGAACGFYVTCSELPPLLAYGETLEEASNNAAEEIAAWNRQKFEPLPEPDRAIWYNGRI